MIITGTHLDVGPLNDQYVITVGFPNGEPVNCSIQSITNTSITCQPDNKPTKKIVASSRTATAATKSEDNDGNGRNVVVSRKYIELCSLWENYNNVIQISSKQ